LQPIPVQRAANDAFYQELLLPYAIGAAAMFSLASAWLQFFGWHSRERAASVGEADVGLSAPAPVKRFPPDQACALPFRRR
jgi:hypothetical protein